MPLLYSPVPSWGNHWCPPFVSLAHLGASRLQDPNSYHISTLCRAGTGGTASKPFCISLSCRLATAFAGHDFGNSVPNRHARLLNVLLREGRRDAHLECRLCVPVAILGSNGLVVGPILEPCNQDAIR